ncbi:MAG: HD domain-containing protein [Eubacteriaceae bacterium]|nr:HD domain-containing protein [Eubacteriaceae bacterium]
MKTLYLIRHGHVAFPDNVRLCIGHTDLPLSDRGKKQATDLYKYFKDKNILVYASPLQRAKQTAAILAGPNRSIQTVETLMELDMGEWENQPLKSIQKTLISEPVQGEKRGDALLRMQSGIAQILEENKTNNCDILCVAHASINSCFIADLLGVPLEISRSFPQPYGGINVLSIDGAAITVKEIGVMPQRAPDSWECEAILNHYRTPQHVQDHNRAVAQVAVAIGEKINQKIEEQADLSSLGMETTLKKIDIPLLRGAACLHDVMRTQKNHAVEGAHILRREGYPEVARIVAQHHDLDNPLIIDEAAILYYADKIVQGSKRVTVEARFSKSKEKIFQNNPSKEAVNAYYRRYRHALIIEHRLKKAKIL